MAPYAYNQESNGFYGRVGSSKSINEPHENTVVASVINESSRRSLSNDQDFEILINKEPDEICLAEFNEGNGILAQINKKNGKQSKEMNFSYSINIF